MARKGPKVGKVPHQDAVSVLLKKKGTTYEAWSKQIINDVCLSLLQGGNVEWRNRILEQASINLIASSIVVENEEIDETKNQTV